MTGCLVFIILLGSFREVQVKQALPQAKLTVNSSIITETDSVTLSCRAPANFSVHQCYFYVNGGTLTPFSCMKTFTGTELLLMAKQSSSSVAEVRCFYIVNYGDRNSPSPDSDMARITIRLKPQLSVHYVKGMYSLFLCFLPESVKNATTCNLYFGESSHPTATTTTWKTKSSETGQRFCRIVIEENELLWRLRLVQQKEVSCDYSLKGDRKTLSLRSDPYSFRGKVTEIRTIPTRSTRTAGSVDSVFPTNVSSSVTSNYKVAEITEKAGSHEPKGKNIDMKTLIITTAVAGVIVIFILMAAACFRAKRRTEKGSHKRKQTNITDQSVQMIDDTEMLHSDAVYSIITSVPAADSSTNSGKSAVEDSSAEDSDVDSLYYIIPDLPPPSSTGDRV
ncbi:uncharacterized protein LOC111605799 isoform X1 [Xiphophorus maculatus]|uniref:uncharacterized protein LOC111605799 isoform X1 n=2 Tax=Xiphophorus maculatus TaxID=8083 RepID=UPI000C6E465C|nr:uncharacterized protein LOC111605799 isoform X1 [Xiphophorus maculatus]